MISYETLDRIADAYIPLLALASVIAIGANIVSSRWRLAGSRVLSVGIGLFIAYGLMFLDHQLNLWPAVGLDYSTHTAVSLVFVGFLALEIRRWAILWTGSFAGYLLLMMYQGYHTGLDIVSTSAAVGIPVVWVLGYVRRRQNI
jgi:hypothetical protein